MSGDVIAHDILTKIRRLSEWVDTFPANASRDPEAALWGRVTKVGEEIGEAEEVGAPDAVVRLLTRGNGRVVAALVGALGQNPRKGVTNDMFAVQHRLFGLVVWSLQSYERLFPAQANGPVGKEILDVAMTALCAIEHIDRAVIGRHAVPVLPVMLRNVATAASLLGSDVALQAHVTATVVRAGLSEEVATGGA